MIEHGRIAEVYSAIASPNLAGRLALQFVMLTGLRSGEARAARWSEIDGDALTVPAERMKMAAGAYGPAVTGSAGDSGAGSQAG